MTTNDWCYIGVPSVYLTDIQNDGTTLTIGFMEDEWHCRSIEVMYGSDKRFNAGCFEEHLATMYGLEPKDWMERPL